MLGRAHRWIPALAWGLILAAVALLMARFDRLPASVPVFRALSGVPTQEAPKGLFSVLRVPGMGAAQLSAVASMSSAARRAGDLGWARFWSTLSLAIAAKTALESLELALLGARSDWPQASVLRVATIAVVMAFALWALRAWQRGMLRSRLAIDGWSGLGAALSLGAYAALATGPLWR
jgi:hypothetical protein